MFIACGLYGSSGTCFARNDDPIRALDAVATVTLARVSGAGAVVAANTTRISLPRGAAAVQWWCLGSGDVLGSCEPLASWLARLGCAANGSDCMLFTQLADASSGAVLASSWELLGVPGLLSLAADPALAWAIAPTPNADGSVNITLTAAAPAAFVTLTTLAQGRFSENVVFVGGAAGATRTVMFLPFGPLDYTLLTTSLRVEHLGQYLSE